MAPAAGRPTRITTDRGGVTGGRLDLRARMAWLARTVRCASGDPGNQRQVDFARRLTERGVNASNSRISMWENGHQAMSLEVMGGYERVLDLTPALLQATATALSRGVRRRGRLPIAEPRGEISQLEGQRRLDAVYDAAMRGTCVGSDWFALAAYWNRVPTAMTPVAIVRQLMLVLVDEVARAVGPAYTTRYQALGMVIDHPVYSPIAVETIHDYAVETGVDSVMDVLGALGECQPNIAVTRELISLARTGNGRVRAGAVYALETSMLLRVLPQEALPHVQRLTQMLRAGSVQDLRLAERLVRQLIELGVVERPSRVPRPAPDRRATSKVVAQYVTRAREATGLPQDPVLVNLLEEAHGHDHHQYRHHVALLLMASPYRPALADHALTVALSGPTGHEAYCAAWLLTYLAHPEQDAALLAAIANGPESLRSTLLMARTHARPVPPEVDLVALQPDTSSESPLVYAAGMSQHPLLATWAGQNKDPSLRERAQWWQRHGGAVRE